LSSASPICSNAMAWRRAATAVPSFSAAAKPSRKPLLSASPSLIASSAAANGFSAAARAPAPKSSSNRYLACAAI
jgi:hypothetical protein